MGFNLIAGDRSRLLMPVFLLAACLATWAVLRLRVADTLHGRWWLAAVVALAYLAFCAVTAWRHRQARQRQRAEETGVAGATGEVAAPGEEPPVLVAFASQTGFAEELARLSAQSLREAGKAVRVLPLGRVDDAALLAARQFFVVASTTGEGDAPDAAQAFAQRMEQADSAPSLAHLRFGVLALGDRGYAHYCAFGHALDGWLRQRHAQALFDVVEVDNGDDGALRHWQQQLGMFSGRRERHDWRAPQYGRWRLAARTWLNPGSLGGPAFHLALVPLEGALPAWDAGDIAEIGPRNGAAAVERCMQALSLTGETWRESLAGRWLPEDADALAALRALPPEDLLAQLPLLPHREYSISSLPIDGRLELLVRRAQLPDGRSGLGSGWLTEHAPEGAGIALRLRRNSGFHMPPDDRPMILIGSGTGLAGLRAQLKARQQAGHRRNWLLFGERSRAHDHFHGDEIEQWRAQGHLMRLDLVFSRDGGPHRYVQDCLRAQAEAVHAWVAQGAAIYVCGSARGMAEGVHAALCAALGEQRLVVMAASGHYRRDVY